LVLVVASLVALASAGATSVRAAEGDELGATIQSRVYVDDGGAMIVWNQSSVPARFTFEPAPGWAVEPPAVNLEPDEQKTVSVTGDGEDGAGIDVRVMAVAAPPPGVSASEIVLTSRVFYEAPVDWARLAGQVLLALAAAVVVLWLLWRLKPWQLRLTRATR
jgi:hypothetical protein